MSRARDLSTGKFSGTLEAPDLSDGTLTVGTEYVTNGSAKAWAVFTGTGTVAVNDSLNISSVTDAGVSAYSFSLSSAFATANYAIQAQGVVGSSGFIGNSWKTADDQTTSSTGNFFIGYRQSSSGAGTAVDTPKGSVSMHGDLA